MKNLYDIAQSILPSFVFKSVNLFGVSAALTMVLCLAETGRIHAAPGDLDPSFGTGGKVVNSTEGLAMTLQPDGKVIVVGRNSTGQFTKFGIVRYNPNGTLDQTFGTGGKAIISIGNFSDYAQAVIAQPDGKIIVAGSTSTSGGSNSNFAVVRLNGSGDLDPTFGTGGKVTTAVGGSSSSEAHGAALQPDGKIVLAGSCGSFSAADFALVRYNSDGSLDASFDSDGQVTTPVGSGFEAINSVVVQSDGRIVAAGQVDDGLTKWGIARYETTGALDASFGTGGKVIGSFRANDGSAQALAVQSDGKIIVVGGSRNSGNRYDFAVARVNQNGTFDTGFGTGGVVFTRIRYSSFALAVALQRNGKIVVAGSSDVSAAGGWNFAVARYTTNGLLDANFGSGGSLTTQVAVTQENARAVTIQADGKIVVAGELTNNHAVVRYLGDAVSRPAFDFDGDGKTDYGVFRPANGTWYLLNSQSGFAAAAFGIGTDKPVPADYDGDGKTDIAVYRGGVWYLSRSQAGFTGINFGNADDLPVPADFDGDGKAEIAVFRPSSGYWYLLNLATNQLTATPFGQNNDVPVPADYDGDGKSDLAVFRPSNGTWYVQGSQSGFTGTAFGVSADKPVPADYDGDGKADVAVARQSGGTTVWYIFGSTRGFYGRQFGLETDRLAAGDYDGDGSADIAVWRGGAGAFYVLGSVSGQLSAVQFGQSGDAPLAASFVR